MWQHGRKHKLTKHFISSCIAHTDRDDATHHNWPLTAAITGHPHCRYRRTINGQRLSINQSINPDKIFRVARPPQGLWPGKEGRGDRPGAIITAGRCINTGQLRDSPAAEMELTFRRELTIAAANCVQVPRHTASIHTRTPTHRRDRTFALPRRCAPSRKPPSRTSVLIRVRG